MSVYFVKGKGWRYDFTHKGIRHTETWFKTKTEANRAEAEKRKEINNPKPVQEMPTDITFLELVNFRLDHVKAYFSAIHYAEHVFKARKWVALWGQLNCNDISSSMLQKFIFERKRVSARTANKEIMLLKALFNFGIKKKLVTVNPVNEIEFFSVEKRTKYLPPLEDINKVIASADLDIQDYLITIQDTMGRMSEINHLTWEDVDLSRRSVTLYTRKKKGGHLTPRKVAMTQRLSDILSRRFDKRVLSIPYVFWQKYWSRKEGQFVTGPYIDRKRIMKTLCKKAGVKYFRFHALRHSGASIMESSNVPIGSIQRILGHENRSTTEIYLHSIGEAERSAIAIFEQVQQKSHTDSHTETK
jgi:integrase